MKSGHRWSSDQQHCKKPTHASGVLMAVLTSVESSDRRTSPDERLWTVVETRGREHYCISFVGPEVHCIPELGERLPHLDLE